MQNWFDACVERCGGSRRDVTVVTASAPAVGLGLGASGIIYLALHGDVLAGYLADYEVRASAPSFFRKFQISSSRFLGELFIDIQY